MKRGVAAWRLVFWPFFAGFSVYAFFGKGSRDFSMEPALWGSGTALAVLAVLASIRRRTSDP